MTFIITTFKLIHVSGLEEKECVVLDQISLVRKVYRKYRKQTLPLGYLDQNHIVVLDQISLVRKVYRKYRKQTLPLGYLDHIMALNRGRHDFTKDPGGSQKHCFL